GELRELPESTLSAVASDLGALDHQLRIEDGELPLVSDALAASGVVASKSAARRAINEGGAYLNNVKVADAEARLTREDLLAGRWAVLRRGKRTVGIVEVR
ncbi:MAG: S4 domain-containing protein, partial [Brooklawnia sp.]